MNVILKAPRLKVHPLRSGMRQDMLPPHASHTALQPPATSREEKGTSHGKERKKSSVGGIFLPAEGQRNLSLSLSVKQTKENLSQ